MFLYSLTLFLSIDENAHIWKLDPFNCSFQFRGFPYLVIRFRAFFVSSFQMFPPVDLSHAHFPCYFPLHPDSLPLQTCALRHRTTCFRFRVPFDCFLFPSIIPFHCMCFLPMFHSIACVSFQCSTPLRIFPSIVPFRRRCNLPLFPSVADIWTPLPYLGIFTLQESL